MPGWKSIENEINAAWPSNESIPEKSVVQQPDAAGQQIAGEAGVSFVQQTELIQSVIRSMTSYITSGNGPSPFIVEYWRDRLTSAAKRPAEQTKQPPDSDDRVSPVC